MQANMSESNSSHQYIVLFDQPPQVTDNEGTYMMKTKPYFTQSYTGVPSEVRQNLLSINPSLEFIKSYKKALHLSGI